jgi:hypothetical protein
MLSARKIHIENAGAAYHVMAYCDQERDTYADERKCKLRDLLPTNQGVAGSRPVTAELPAERGGERRTWRGDDPSIVYEKMDLANRHGGASVLRVSASEIIQELPKLSPAERRTVRRVLSDLAAKDEDVRLCNKAATEAAMMFHRMEEEDARRQQG